MKKKKIPNQFQCSKLRHKLIRRILDDSRRGNQGILALICSPRTVFIHFREWSVLNFCWRSVDDIVNFVLLTLPAFIAHF